MGGRSGQRKTILVKLMHQPINHHMLGLNLFAKSPILKHIDTPIQEDNLFQILLLLLL